MSDRSADALLLEYINAVTADGNRTTRRQTTLDRLQTLLSAGELSRDTIEAHLPHLATGEIEQSSPANWRFVADCLAVAPAAGYSLIPILQECLYFDAADEAARALAHTAVHDPTNTQKTAPRLFRMLDERPRLPGVTERHWGAGEESATIIPSVFAIGAITLSGELYPPAALRRVKTQIEHRQKDDSQQNGHSPFIPPDREGDISVTEPIGISKNESRSEQIIAICLGWFAVQHPAVIGTLRAWTGSECAVVRNIAIQTLGIISQFDSLVSKAEIELFVETVVNTAKQAELTHTRRLCLEQLRLTVESTSAHRITTEALPLLRTTVVETIRNREVVDIDGKLAGATALLLFAQLYHKENSDVRQHQAKRFREQLGALTLSLIETRILTEIWLEALPVLSSRNLVSPDDLLITVEFALIYRVGGDRIDYLEGHISELAGRLAGDAMRNRGIAPVAVHLAQNDSIGEQRLGTAIAREIVCEHGVRDTEGEMPHDLAAITTAVPLFVKLVRTNSDPAVRADAIDVLRFVHSYAPDCVEPYLTEISPARQDLCEMVRQSAKLLLNRINTQE